MGLPKGYKTNIKTNLGKIGVDRRQEILDGISSKGTFLPRQVLEEDMDLSVVEFVSSDDGLSITTDGKKIPVIFLTIQRWTEFSKTWQHSDKYKDIELPFITIVRKPDIQQGQNQAGLWNIPGNNTYTYYKVPTNDGIRQGIDLYKVPQPTSVDITYEVRLFSNKMKDLNRYNRKFQRAFQSKQCYISVNGHPMPLHLENISDESNIDDFENRKFYVQLFELKLLGYILDEEDFEIVPTLNRTMVVSEILDVKKPSNIIFDPKLINGIATFRFVFKPKSDLQFTFIAENNLNFTGLTSVENITRIVISINGVGIFDGLVIVTPMVINTNDSVLIRVYKNINKTGMFILNGTG